VCVKRRVVRVTTRRNSLTYWERKKLRVRVEIGG
jgi:hypothetical protein